MEKQIALSLFCGLSFSTLFAQTDKYLVYFRDKAESPYTTAAPEMFLSEKALARRGLQGILVDETDFPPNPSYIQSIMNTGAKVLRFSRWFNAALVSCTGSQLSEILSLPKISHIHNNSPIRRTYGEPKSKKHEVKTASLDYGDASTQISFLGVGEMHSRGYHGEGLWIAIMDDGFLNSNAISCLDSVFASNQVLEIYDFVDEDSTVFSDGGHGTNVFSCLAANLPGSIISPAIKSKFALFRTEDGGSETHLEEVNWLMAAERADSLGIDIKTTSLGYSEFDNPSDNYTYSDMDGNTAIISQAADLAASKGMLLVNSAGNEGNSAWHYITAPADGDSVLAIGAVSRSANLVNFSSRGPSYDNRIKPDLMAVGENTALCSTYGHVGTSNGTSFSAPLVAAMSAGFWQANRHLTAFEVMDCLRKSGDRYSSPNHDYGFGLANFIRADSLAKVEYGIELIEKKGLVNSYCIEAMGPSPQVLFNFSTAAVGKKLRITFIDQDLKQALQQSTFVLPNTIYEERLTFDTLNPNILMRMENISDVKTELIVRF